MTEARRTLKLGWEAAYELARVILDRSYRSVHLGDSGRVAAKVEEETLMQRGNIFKSSGSWYVRFYEARGRRVTRRLGRVSDYPTERSIEPLAQDILRVVNRSTDAAISLDDFIALVYLPHTLELRPSTSDGYKKLYGGNIKGREEAQLKVREYRTVDCQRLLDAIAKAKPLTSTTLGHIKAFLSGVFKYAAQTGVREGNPVAECRVPKAGREKAKTYAYSLGEIQRILLVLPLDLKALVATAAFAGLRRSELAGLEWSDHDGGSIKVQRSVWRGHTSDPKTSKSKDYVPVVPQLRAILDTYRASLEPLGARDGRIWTLDLEKAGRGPISKLMLSVGLTWKGWHSFRRGIASNLFSLGVDDVTVQRVLRHSKVTVTREHYIQVRDSRLDEAMAKLSGAIGVA